MSGEADTRRIVTPRTAKMQRIFLPASREAFVFTELGFQWQKSCKAASLTSISSLPRKTSMPSRQGFKNLAVPARRAPAEGT